MSSRWLLLLGSNLPSNDNLYAALRALDEHGSAQIVTGVHHLPPRGGDGHAYFNALAVFTTPMQEGEVRHLLKRIEAALGRSRDAGPVVAIDIDPIAHDRGAGWVADPRAIEKGELDAWPVPDLLSEADVVVRRAEPANLDETRPE